MSLQPVILSAKILATQDHRHEAWRRRARHQIVTAGPPSQVASHRRSATAPFLRTTLEEMSVTA
jgi:hypothetical protein